MDDKVQTSVLAVIEGLGSGSFVVGEELKIVVREISAHGGQSVFQLVPRTPRLLVGTVPDLTVVGQEFLIPFTVVNPDDVVVRVVPVNNNLTTASLLKATPEGYLVKALHSGVGSISFNVLSADQTCYHSVDVEFRIRAVYHPCPLPIEDKTLKIGETVTIDLQVDNLDDVPFVWAVANVESEVVETSLEGSQLTIKGVKDGYTQFRIIADDGKEDAIHTYVRVHILPLPEVYNLPPSDFLNVGETHQLLPVVENGKLVSTSTSDASVIRSRKVGEQIHLTPTGTGEAEVTATFAGEGGTTRRTFTVKVYPAHEESDTQAGDGEAGKLANSDRELVSDPDALTLAGTADDTQQSM